MVRSMTGYGRAEQSFPARTISIEMKSVNHRYFELSVRTPRGCGYLEDRLKSLVQSRVSRGKIEVSVNITSTGGGDAAVRVNLPLAQCYLSELRALARVTGLVDDVTLSTISRLPDVFSVEKTTLDEEAVWSDVQATALLALDRFVSMRIAEGTRLGRDILGRLAQVEKLTNQIRASSPKTVADYRARLYQKLSELLSDRTIDEGRLITETALFADRIDVSEETVRLASHLAQFDEILQSGDAVGRKLDFLTQEMNREVNTIGSKAQDADAAAMVVELKSELEKIREQIQNLE
ncbi:MAG: YicC/YloC family endoribonuclease [Oscillospiraceae bacterium]